MRLTVRPTLLPLFLISALFSYLKNYVQELGFLMQSPCTRVNVLREVTLQLCSPRGCRTSVGEAEACFCPLRFGAKSTG